MAALRADPQTAVLPERSRAIVDWALKATRTPAAMREQDLEPLRAVGLDDRAILDVALVTAYYAYVNRLASSLGVEVEPGGPPHAR